MLAGMRTEKNGTALSTRRWTPAHGPGRRFCSNISFALERSHPDVPSTVSADAPRCGIYVPRCGNSCPYVQFCLWSARGGGGGVILGGATPLPQPLPLEEGEVALFYSFVNSEDEKKTKEKTWAHFKSLKNLKISSPFYFSPLMFLVLHVTSYNEEENMLINMKILTFEGPC